VRRAERSVLLSESEAVLGRKSEDHLDENLGEKDGGKVKNSVDAARCSAKVSLPQRDGRLKAVEWFFRLWDFKAHFCPDDK
jgi:hypothetical protein